MTISLAIAFSVAVTGPPTDREIEIASLVMSRVAAAVGEEVEAVSIELCPQLPPEVQSLCAREETSRPPKPAPVPESEWPSPVVEVAEVESTVEPQARATPETQLLGEPARQRARPQRVERRPQRVERRPRATAQRANVERRPPPQTRSERRTTTSQPVTTRAPALEPAPVRQDSEEPTSENNAAHETYEEPEYRDWRERREERRRRRRAYEEPAPDAYEEDPAYRDDGYSRDDDYYEEEDWVDGAR